MSCCLDFRLSICLTKNSILIGDTNQIWHNVVGPNSQYITYYTQQLFSNRYNYPFQNGGCVTAFLKAFLTNQVVPTWPYFYCIWLYTQSSKDESYNFFNDILLLSAGNLKQLFYCVTCVFHWQLTSFKSLPFKVGTTLLITKVLVIFRNNKNIWTCWYYCKIFNRTLYSNYYLRTNGYIVFLNFGMWYLIVCYNYCLPNFIELSLLSVELLVFFVRTFTFWRKELYECKH